MAAVRGEWLLSCCHYLNAAGFTSGTAQPDMHVTHLCALNQGVQLRFCESRDQQLKLHVADALALREVEAMSHERVAVPLKDNIHGALTDIQCWRVREKVIPD
jgi:hypothetical protein